MVDSNHFRKIKQQITAFVKKHRKAILIIMALAVVLPEVSVYFHRPGRGADMHGYVQAGKDALALKDLYLDSRSGRHNTWPPFFSFVCIPLALSERYFGLPITKEIWYFFNFFLLLAAVKIWMFVLTATSPKFISDEQLDFTSNIVFAPLLVVLPAIINNFYWLQINILILFLVVCGYYYYRKNAIIVSGVFFALAASLKAFPVLILFYFVIRKQWRIALWMGIFGIAFTISPIIFYGVGDFFELFKKWLTLSFNRNFVVWHYHDNQSLYAMWERYLFLHLKITQPTSALIHTFYWLSVLGILGLTIMVFLKTRYQNPSWQALLEFSSICVLMIILPPIGWRHYFVFLYPAAATIYLLLKRHPYLFDIKSIRSLSIIAAVLLIVPYLSGKDIAYFFRMINNWTWAAISVNALILMLLNKAQDYNLENDLSLPFNKRS